MIEFSVIIPTFNSAKTIREAIDSALMQQHAPTEIIVVDDGSTDETVRLVESYGEKVRLIRFDRNRGVSVARNAGWAAAAGAYLAFLDSDDVWHPAKLKVVAETFLQDPALALVAHARCVGTFPEMNLGERGQAPIRFSEMLVSNPFQTSCVCLRRDLPERFHSEMRFCEDFDLLLRIVYRHPSAQLRLPLTKLARPQLSKGGLSNQTWRMRLGEMRSYWNLRKLHGAFSLLFPLFFFWSLGKHLKTLVGIRPRFR